MDKREKVARAICAEKCAFMGEPPCYTVEGEWPNPNCQEPGCHAEAQAAIAALEPMDKPRVRPLDWTKKGYAETPFGKYHVVMEDWSGQDDFWFVCFAGKPYGKCGEHASEVAAKAAAQADYEARVLAALEPVTDGPNWEGFGRDLLESWPVRDVDGSELFDAALRNGLIQEIPGGYDPDRHIDAEGICPEKGDPWYEYAFK